MLENIKLLLGITDTDRDELLNLIINLTTNRLLNLLGGVEDVPEELEYIVVQVSVKRFNRIGSEGTTAHTQEGETLTFADDDFSEFENDIAYYIGRTGSESAKGVQFL